MPSGFGLLVSMLQAQVYGQGAKMEMDEEDEMDGLGNLCRHKNSFLWALNGFRAFVFVIIN